MRMDSAQNAHSAVSNWAEATRESNNLQIELTRNPRTAAALVAFHERKHSVLLFNEVACGVNTIEEARAMGKM